MSESRGDAFPRGGADIFIVNPRSAAGTTLRRFEGVRPIFQKALPALEVWHTRAPGHATALARQAIAAGARSVIAVGGDGTNHEVINGFFDEQGQRHPGDTAFGMLTSGTGGDFRRTLGWDLDPRGALQRIAAQSPRLVDVGRVHVEDPAGGMRLRHFLNIGSFGISGEIVETVNRSSKRLGSQASFLVGTLRNVIAYRPVRISLSLDGAPPGEIDVTAVIVANGQYFGGGMWVAPEARVDDGWLDVVIVRGGGLGMWLRHGYKLYSGRHRDIPEVSTHRVRRLRALPLTGSHPAASPGVRLELDGEAAGLLPVTFEVVPRALPLLM